MPMDSMTGVGPIHDRGPSARARHLMDLAETRFVPITTFLLALGVIFRLLLVWLTTSPSDTFNHFYQGYGDGQEYLDNARSLVEHGVYGYAGRPSAFRPPAYPLVLALTLRLFGNS